MPATSTNKKFAIVSSQKPDGNGFIVSGRIDSTAYEAMIGLTNLFGYESVSSFVRQAVLEKCRNMSSSMSGMFQDRL